MPPKPVNIDHDFDHLVNSDNTYIHAIFGNKGRNVEHLSAAPVWSLASRQRTTSAVLNPPKSTPSKWMSIQVEVGEQHSMRLIVFGISLLILWDTLGTVAAGGDAAETATLWEPR